MVKKLLSKLQVYQKSPEIYSKDIEWMAIQNTAKGIREI